MTEEHAQDWMKRPVTIDQQFASCGQGMCRYSRRFSRSKRQPSGIGIDRGLAPLINLQLATLIPVVDASNWPPG